MTHTILVALALIGVFCVLSMVGVVFFVLARMWWLTTRTPRRPLPPPQDSSRYERVTRYECVRDGEVIPLGFFAEPERRVLREVGARLYPEDGA